MNKETKQQMVAELHEKLQRAKAVFLADFRGMNVGKATELRNELRKAGVEYKVVKNTLLDLASQETDPWQRETYMHIGPSREVLIAKLLGTMQAPTANFVGVLAAVPGSFVRVLNAIKTKKEGN